MRSALLLALVLATASCELVVGNENRVVGDAGTDGHAATGDEQSEPQPEAGMMAVDSGTPAPDTGSPPPCIDTTCSDQAGVCAAACQSAAKTCVDQCPPQGDCAKKCMATQMMCEQACSTACASCAAAAACKQSACPGPMMNQQ